MADTEDFNRGENEVVNASDSTGGTLRYALAADFDSTDPANTYYAFNWNFSRYYARTLLAFNPDATIKGEMLPSHGATGPGHLALGVRAEALGEWRERLEGHGVAIEKEVAWPRGGRSLYFRDPANNSVELVTPGLWGLPGGW